MGSLFLNLIVGRTRAAAFCAGIFLLGAVTAFGQIDPNQIRDQQRRSRQDQYRSMQTMARNMPKLESAKQIEDVFQIHVDEQKKLSCITPALDAEQQTGRQFRLELEGFDGPTYAHISTAANRLAIRGPGQAPVVQPKIVRTFSLTSIQMPNPDTLVTINAQSFPGTFHVDRSVQMNDGHWMVRLTEQRNNGVNDAGTVQLWVIHYGSDVDQPINLNISEPDFPTLVRLHPREVDEHLRPLLRQLGQDQLFAPEAKVAWQVLADSWPADEETTRQVRTILPDLNSPEFRIRERGLAAITKLGRAGASSLRRLDRNGLSSEQNRLLDLALTPYEQLESKEAARLGKDRGFLVDCLYSDDRPIRAAAADRLKVVTSRSDLSFDADASPAERYGAARMIRQTLFAPTTKPSTLPATSPATTQPTN